MLDSILARASAAASNTPVSTPHSSTTVVNKTPQTKMSAAAEPKIVRKVLPFAAFLITFATVMTVLMIYMDTTARSHHQFQLNMTQDYDLMGVSQDNNDLILYIKEWLIKSTTDASINHRTTANIQQKSVEMGLKPTEKEKIIAQLLNNKKFGIFIEAGAYRHGRVSSTEWLERNLSWTGLLIETYPKDLFDLLKRGRTRSKYIHACLSTQPHPKEITIPQEGQDGVKINSVQANSVFSNDDSDGFNTRVKCFPLYSLILAMNTTSVDFINLDTDCSEVDILETIPFERVRIKIISVHDSFCNSSGIEQSSFTQMKHILTTHKYSLVRSLGDDHLFVLKN